VNLLSGLEGELVVLFPVLRPELAEVEGLGSGEKAG